MLATVHGGEEVLTPEQRRGGGQNVFNISTSADPFAIADAISWRMRTQGV
jgi:hypothetical protein